MLRLVSIIPKSKIHGYRLKPGERIVCAFDCADEDFAPVVAVCREDSSVKSNTRESEAVPEDAVGVLPARDAGGVQGLSYKWNDPKAHVVYDPFRYDPIKVLPEKVSVRKNLN
jgi:hypothetical protein